MKQTCTHSPPTGNLWTPGCMFTKLGEHWVLMLQNTEAFGGIRDLQWSVVHKLGVELASQNTCMNNSGHGFKGFTGPPTTYLWPLPQSSYTNTMPSAKQMYTLRSAEWEEFAEDINAKNRGPPSSPLPQIKEPPEPTSSTRMWKQEGKVLETRPQQQRPPPCFSSDLLCAGYGARYLHLPFSSTPVLVIFLADGA